MTDGLLLFIGVCILNSLRQLVEYYFSQGLTKPLLTIPKHPYTRIHQFFHRNAIHLSCQHFFKKIEPHPNVFHITMPLRKSKLYFFFVPYYKLLHHYRQSQTLSLICSNSQLYYPNFIVKLIFIFPS